tara:strand:+ start:1254 stop:1493 length:240 start_codon:yes stop_codon:yes gene_type:complete
MRKDFGTSKDKMDSPDDEEFTMLDRDIDHIWEKLRDLVREMDREFGNQKMYERWLQEVSFQGDLASYTLQAMEREEYGN